MSKYIKIKRLCNVPKCKKIHASNGLCRSHYNQSRYQKNLEIRKYMSKQSFSYSNAYASYMNMIQRCYNKNNPMFKWYGARGIKVCDYWLKSFENFFKDMGDRPSGLTLERVNNDGNYEASNCRWATRQEQNLNRRPKFSN